MTMRSTTLASSSTPIDTGRITTQLGTPRGRYDEHSSRFSLSKKLRFIDPVGKSQTSEGDAC
jgi:hypothetical protein